jgi:hypothetical protein
VRRKVIIQNTVFYEELEQVFDHFPQYHMKVILGDFNEKIGERE